MCMQAFVRDNTMTLKLVDLNPTDGKKKDGCLKANFDFKICSSTAAIFCGRPVTQSTFLPRSRTVSSMYLQTEPVCCERKVTTFPWIRVSTV